MSSRQVDPVLKNLQNEVGSLLRESFRSNPNPAVKILSKKARWVENKFINNAANELHREGWKLISSLVRLKCIHTASQIQGVRAEVLSIGKSPIGPQGFQAINELFDVAKEHAPQITYSQVLQICNLARLSTEINDGSPDFIRGLTKKIRSADSPPLAFQMALTALESYHSAPNLLPRVGLDKLKRGLGKALVSNEGFSFVDVARYAVDSSDLPEKQKNKFIMALDELATNLGQNPTFVRNIVETIASLHSINSHLDRWSAVSGADLDSKQLRLLNQLKIRMSRAVGISELVEAISSTQRYFEHNIESVIELLEKGVNPENIKKVLAFATISKLPLSEIPEYVAELPDVFRKAIRQDVLKGRVRSGVELKALASEIVSLINDKLLPESAILMFVNLHDYLRASGRTGNNRLVTALAANAWQKLESKNIGKKEHLRLRRAVAARGLFSQAGYDDPTAADYAWSYSAISDPLSQHKQIVRHLLKGPNRRDISQEVRSWSSNPSLSDQEFFEALKLLADVLPTQWVTVYSLHNPEARSYPYNQDRTLTPAEFRALFQGTEDISPKGVEEGYYNATAAKAEKAIRDNLVTFIQTADRTERQTAAAKISSMYHTDTGPYPYYADLENKVPHPAYQRMVNEVTGIYRGCYELHYGFGHLTFECRTPPSGNDWLLTRFALDTAIRIDKLNTVNPDIFPGPGCLISGLKPDKLFLKNPLTPEDPFSLVKEAWPWVANELSDLEATRFFHARGVRGVFAPKTEKYTIDGVHYAFMVWNDHFENSKQWVSALVPSTILAEAFKGKFTQISEAGQKTKFSDNESAHGSELTYEVLAAKCAARGMNILNLGWASNLGGLCNAFPAQSKPYFEWETKLSGHTADKARHIHKSHISGRYITKMDSATDELLVPMRKAHDLVFGVATAYLNLHDLSRLSLSLWHKGLTVTEDMGEQGELELDDNTEAPLGQNETRMLEEAYRWHKLREKGVMDKDAYPILCLTSTLNYWTRVKSPVYLDTFDLKLITPTFEDTLPEGSSGTGGFESTIWKNHVRPHYYQRPDIDLRFMDRRDLSL